jgi:hypothetical protein
VPLGIPPPMHTPDTVTARGPKARAILALSGRLEFTRAAIIKIPRESSPYSERGLVPTLLPLTCCAHPGQFSIKFRHRAALTL